MSKYTMNFLDVVLEENKTDSLLSIDEKIMLAKPYIFDFNYPVIDDITKNRIEVGIIKHYLFREIAFENLGIFKVKLNARLNEIMPRYNQAYRYYEKELNPFINSYSKNISNQTNNSDSTSDSTSDTTVDGDNFNSVSDTPQGILTELKEGKYSSGASVDVNKTTTNNKDNNKSNSNSTSDVTSNFEGLSISEAEAFQTFIDSLISIDERLYYEFSDLFMMIY